MSTPPPNRCQTLQVTQRGPNPTRKCTKAMIFSDLIEQHCQQVEHMKLIVKRIDKDENKKKEQKSKNTKNRTKSRIVRSSNLWSNEPFWIYFILFTVGCLSMFLRTHKLREVFKNIFPIRGFDWLVNLGP